MDTVAVQSDPAADALTLATCPQCEYSLQGLPLEGVCPECGYAYNRSVVILRCHGLGADRLNSNVMIFLAAVIAGGVILIVMMKPQVWHYFTQMMLMLIFLVLLLATTWLDRVTSPRGGAWLLWITSAGIGVQTDLDPDSMLARVRRWSAVAFLPIYVMGGMAPMILTSPWPLLASGIAVAMGIGMFVLQRTMIVKPALPASGPRPALFGWESVSRFEVKETKLGQYRLRAMNKSWVAKNRPLAMVNFDGSNELVAQLRQRITELSGGKVMG